MEFILFLSFILWFFYVVVLGMIQKEWPRSKDLVPHNKELKFSIIIPARNEENNILACIRSILGNDFPQSDYEIIVIDDHSSDKTFELVRSLENKNLQIYKLEDLITGQKNSYKKWAIHEAIKKAQFSTIVTTDADCVVGKNWLNELSSFYQNPKVKCVTGPVIMNYNSSLISSFQSYDNAGMMAVTKAGILRSDWFLANGANFSFDKQTYLEYFDESNLESRASGDDMFLVQFIANNYPGAVCFASNKNSAVYCDSMNTLGDFISQRIRWASKNNGYKSLSLTILMGLIWVFCSVILLSIFISVKFALILFLLKAFVDLLYIRPMSPFFNLSLNPIKTIFLSICHTLYVSIFGLFSLIPIRYNWKGRNVR